MSGASALAERVWSAHGDAWQAEGRLRQSRGGGAVALPGIRLMSSGLPHAQWKTVTSPIPRASTSKPCARGMRHGLTVMECPGACACPRAANLRTGSMCSASAAWLCCRTGSGQSAHRRESLSAKRSQRMWTPSHGSTPPLSKAQSSRRFPGLRRTSAPRASSWPWRRLTVNRWVSPRRSTPTIVPDSASASSVWECLNTRGGEGSAVQ